MFNTIEEANKKAQDDEWQSINFDLQRDIPMPFFEERMATCRACDKLTQLNFCSECNCFMPLKTRLKGSSCPINKWQEYVIQPSEKIVE